MITVVSEDPDTPDAAILLDELSDTLQEAAGRLHLIRMMSALKMPDLLLHVTNMAMQWDAEHFALWRAALQK